MQLNGKRVLVTGSTSGIGLAIAKAMAEAGADVLLNGFGDSRSAIAELAGYGHEVLYHPADLADPQQIHELFAYANAQWGGVDILVNNAGIQHVAPIESFPAERWDAILAINLSAVFHCIQQALPRMRQRGWGRIINIASVHGQVASLHKAAYVAAKHGVLGLTKVVALETADSAITCNALCPGWVLTPLVQQQIAARATDGNLDTASRALLAEKQPSQTFVTPEQLAQLALFLCSDAASQVRGAAWNVDGGWLAQ